MIRRPPRATLDRSSAASDVYKRQEYAEDTRIQVKSKPFHLKGFLLFFLPEPAITLPAVAFPFIVFPFAVLGTVDIISVQVKSIVIALSLIHISEPTRPY